MIWLLVAIVLILLFLFKAKPFPWLKRPYSKEGPKSIEDLIALVTGMLFGKSPVDLYDEATRINDYFCNAAKVYAFYGKEDAKLAALTAAKVAASIQRQSMVEYLEGMSPDIKKAPKIYKLDIIPDRLHSLKRNIQQKDWDMNDIREGKAILGHINPSYLDALNKADPQVFVREYPKLFQD